MTLRLTLRGKLLLTLPLVLSAGLYAGHIFSAGTEYIPPADDRGWNCLTDAECAAEAEANWLIDTASDTPENTPGNPICNAYITIFEDGTWRGDELVFDGKILDESWGDEGSMPKWGYRPYVDNIECPITFHAE